MRRIIIAVVLAAILTPTGVASAHDGGTIQHKDRYLRAKVVQKHGKNAPGCDLVAKQCKKWPDPSYKRIRVYFNQLRRLAFPGQFLVARAVPPAQAPAGTQTANVSATGLAACIVGRESGGDPMAQNGQYKGIAQWSAHVWQRDGGTQYATTPHGATKQQQLRVLNSGLTRYGCNDWCPYDGC